jgi:hypothetical protein
LIIVVLSLYLSNIYLKSTLPSFSAKLIRSGQNFASRTMPEVPKRLQRTDFTRSKLMGRRHIAISVNWCSKNRLLRLMIFTILSNLIVLSKTENAAPLGFNTTCWRCALLIGILNLVNGAKMIPRFF